MEIKLSDVLTSLSLLIVLATWLLTHMRTKKDTKITNTVNLINHLSTVPHLLEADLSIRQVISRDDGLITDNLDEATQRDLNIILDYYEFISELYEKDIIDRESVEHLRGGLMMELYDKSRTYIESCRAELQRDDLYKKFEIVCDQCLCNKKTVKS